jgi:hypothetical protein
MSLPPEHLLRPSLSTTETPRRAPFGLQAAFLASFFGGPFTAVAMQGLNAWRLSRLKGDAWWILACLAAYAAFEWWMQLAPAGLEARRWMEAEWGTGVERILRRLIALLIFTLGMLAHRSEQRAADLLGMPRPDGFKVGVGLIAFGWGASALWLALLS